MSNRITHPNNVWTIPVTTCKLIHSDFLKNGFSKHAVSVSHHLGLVRFCSSLNNAVSMIATNLFSSNFRANFRVLFVDEAISDSRLAQRWTEKLPRRKPRCFSKGFVSMICFWVPFVNTKGKRNESHYFIWTNDRNVSSNTNNFRKKVPS